MPEQFGEVWLYQNHKNQHIDSLKLMEDTWALFCGQSNCSKHNTEICSTQFVAVSNPTSCVNHILTIFFDALLLTLVLLSMICRTYFKKVGLQHRSGCLSALQILSAILNSCLGLVYIGLGIFNLEEKLKNEQSMLPVHGWVVFLIQGFTWLLVGLMASLGGNYLPKTFLQSLSSLTFFSAAILSVASVIYNEATVKGIIDVLSFLGATMLLVCTYKGYNKETGKSENDSTLYTLLNGEAASGFRVDPATRFTPFSEAGLLSKMLFWWLNPLMVLGVKKTLHEEDIPKLRVYDGAEACYLQFLDQYTKQKEDESSLKSSIMWTIIACNQNEILISGFFALISILTLSAGPLLLNAFIKVAVDKEAFRYESYVLSISLFLLKVLQSLSQRQWYFRSKLVGVKIRTLFTSLIYKKQLKLSSDARKIHSGGEIMNYAIVDAYRIGEFPLRFHKTWTTSLQICIAVAILIRQVGLATIGSLLVLIILALCNLPLAKLQQRFQGKLMAAQDERLKACTEILVNMKVLKLYAWETHFKTIIEGLRNVEYEWLSRVYFGRGFRTVLYWICPVPVFAATFGSCYFLKLPLNASNVFTFVATLRLLQDPIAEISDVVGVLIQARVAFTRIVSFLEAPELQTEDIKRKSNSTSTDHAILMMSANLSWELNQSQPILNNISLDVRPGEKIAICGKLSSGKSTLLAAVLGEVPYIDGTVEVFRRLAYVSQKAWIKTGTIRDNVLFGSVMDELRYQETLRRCSLVKDLELLPYGDMTEIGERGVNLSGGQKQRVQLARALYRDADIYILDDPFSAVDAQTATSLFNEYVMGALSRKTVLLVTHQVDFLPAFQRCLLMSDGQIIQAGPYHELLESSREFLGLVNAHKETTGTECLNEVGSSRGRNKTEKTNIEIKSEAFNGDQLIKQEEREIGDTGIKPYMLYLDNKTGYIYFWVAVISNLTFVLVQIAQNYWLASGVDNPHISTSKLIVVYLIISTCSTLFIPVRTFAAVRLGMQSSKSLFFRLTNSLFRAPMSFYDSTPLGRILSRITSDLSIVDLDISHIFILTLSPTINAVASLGLLAAITPQVLLLYVPVFYMTVRLQIYYFKTAKELMRINGTTKSLVSNHLAESVAGATTIRAFEEEECFFAKILNHLDTNSSPFFHNFAANEWLILRLEILNAVILSSVALCLLILPPGSFNSGIVGMALAYGLSLSTSVVYSIQFQCTLANSIVSVERLNQYIHLPTEALEVIEDCRPPENWPSVGKVEISNLKIRYSPEAPLVLRGISCTFEGGDKIGIVGRTGSGKTTMIGALFRLVEPAGGKIIVDNVDICSIGLHDLRSRFGIIPQEPTLFKGTVRFNLDPLCQHTDAEIWEVLRKCQLKESVQKRNHGLESLVVEDGLDWSMGQRQLFCLGRVLLRRNRVLILDEATASIDNATDMILQKTIRAEFSGSTVITVAHRIPTVMDCTKVLAINDGKLVEYDEPKKLMNNEGSLFCQLVNEYWSQIHSSESP